jgi:hypothetical protein
MFSVGSIDKHIETSLIIGTEATEGIFAIFGQSEVD